MFDVLHEVIDVPGAPAMSKGDAGPVQQRTLSDRASASPYLTFRSTSLPVGRDTCGGDNLIKLRLDLRSLLVEQNEAIPERPDLFGKLAWHSGRDITIGLA